MKHLVSYILIALLLYTQVLYIPLSAYSFEYNREYITKNLCREKDNPNSKCKGCCFLKKEIEQNVPTTNSSNTKDELSLKLIQYDVVHGILTPSFLINDELLFPKVLYHSTLVPMSLVKPPTLFSI